MDEDDERNALCLVLKERCPGAKFRDDDIKKLVDAGYVTENALAAADKGTLERVLPNRLGVVGVLVKTFVKPAEGEPPSNKPKRSRDEHQSSDPVDRVEDDLAARESYCKKLLEAPIELPNSVEELREFLSQRKVQLPVQSQRIYQRVGDPGLVNLSTSAAERTLASFVEQALHLSHIGDPSEASSSFDLAFFTGQFLDHLNEYAPLENELRGLQWNLDTADVKSKVALTAVQPLERPDFMLYVGGTLILRWENRSDRAEIALAKDENASKLKVWSALYYGTLPYVIGGCCGGGSFQWLKLSPSGKGIVAEAISGCYDLKKSRGVALFLQSTIQMHCLLQKLQENLTEYFHLKLYRPIPCMNGGEVIVYPELVSKEVIPPLDEKVFRPLYDSIAGSRYLIQLIHIQTTQTKTMLRLEPVGDPNARPGVLKDLENATHDMLHGLADLHKEGYTHRDLRWENCIKVNVQGEWKWVIIDLEFAGVDEEEWEGDGLRSWDVGTLEDRDGKKIYTKGSDMYQLGKLIVKWLDTCGKGGNEEQEMRARGESMQRERLAAAKLLEDICKNGCQRCGKFDTKPKTGF